MSHHARSSECYDSDHSRTHRSRSSREFDNQNSVFVRTTAKLPPLKEEDKRRIDVAAQSLTPTSSFVTDPKKDSGLEYAHLLPRDANDNLLTKLEFAWGMSPGTLHVDSLANVLPLSADMSRLFDKCCWMLMPEDMVLKILASGGDVPFSQLLNEPTYNYRIIASKDMTDIAIHCPPISAATSTDHMPLEAHTYPFRSLPVITSHVHPCFVLCHIGRLFGRPDYWRTFMDFKRNNEDFGLVLMECLRRYTKWIAYVIPLDSPFYGLPKASAMDFGGRYGVTPVLGRLDRASHVDAVRQRNKRRALREHLAQHEDEEYLDVTDFVHGWVASIQGQTFQAVGVPV